MKPKFISLYMDMAVRISQMSYATRLQVGCILVKDNTIISYGWNGMPAGWENNCEEKVYKISGWLVDDVGCYELKTKPEVLHAEMNCLMKVAQSTESSKDAILFTTTAPCLDCAKAIFQAGISEVIYKKVYRTDQGLLFLEKCGVKLTKLIEDDK